MREPVDYREPEERTTVVTTDRGSGAGMIAGILLAIVAVVAVLFLFGNFTGEDIDPNPTAGIEAPSAPDVDVNVPNPDVDVNVPADTPDAPAATDAPAEPAPTE